DPQCLAYLLAFYDHLCLWEEDSPVPVLHVGWVDKMMVNLSRFSQRARRLLHLSADATRSVVTDQSVHSPTSFYSRKSEQCAPVSPASGSKRVSRRSRTVSATPQGDRPVLPQADGPSDPHLPLSIQTDSPVIELTASAASGPSHTAISLTEQGVMTSDLSTPSHPVHSLVDSSANRVDSPTSSMNLPKWLLSPFVSNSQGIVFAVVICSWTSMSGPDMTGLRLALLLTVVLV
ncbi:hypothetical protein AHF37_12366, partial [Paragonimus kellicotti]